MVKGKSKTFSGFRKTLNQLGIVLAVFVVVTLFFGIATKTFFSIANIKNIFLTLSITGMLGIGMTFTVISGGYDLSMGSAMCFAGVIAGYMMTVLNLPVIFGIIVPLIFGAVLGILNGFMITKMKLPPFIATLGTMMLCKGMSLIVTGGMVYALSGSDYASFVGLVSDSVLGKIIPGLNISNSIIIFIIIAILSHLLLTKTVFGKFVFAIGSNEEAVKLSGINADKYRVLIYMIAGIFSGIAGVLMSARLTSVQPGIGQGYEMDAIAATVLGGTPLSGGEGSIVGTVLGVLTLTILLNGMRLMSINTNWQTVMTGVVVVVAVFVDAMKRK